MYDFREIEKTDPAVAEAIQQEITRQKNAVELIASENFVSPAVMAALGSPLTNKYAEGYPGHRYYGGCGCVDVVENLAIQRAKELFGAEYVNVQPHAGSQANFAVYFGLLHAGDTIMGMSLAHGGHLTHGSPVNVSGTLYNFVSYGVSEETGCIDYDEVERIALECRPKLIVAGASAYPRIIDFERFRAIADKVDAMLMVDMAHIAGLVAAGEHPSPVPYADVVTTTTHKTLRGPRGGMILARAKYEKALNKAIFPGIQGGPLMHVIAAKAVSFAEAQQPSFKAYQHQIVLKARALAEALLEKGLDLVSGGTDNHMMLVDLRSKHITGRKAEKLLDEVGITCNKNAIPFDPEKPSVTSGIRLGTPAVTTRGMKEDDMRLIAFVISQVIADPEGSREEASRTVAGLLEKYPLY